MTAFQNGNRHGLSGGPGRGLRHAPRLLPAICVRAAAQGAL